MREVGVRELKTHLSEILDAVVAGESLRVTRHGRVIADLTPAATLTDEEHFHLLVAQGRIHPATEPHRPAPKPLKPLPGRSGTAEVLKDRASER